MRTATQLDEEYRYVCETTLSGELIDVIHHRFNPGRYGDLPRWLSVLEQFPDITPSVAELTSPEVGVGRASDCAPAQQTQITQLLHELHPWRKGPFRLFDIGIDTEWRSDWKWSRVQQAIPSMQGRRILDVGCGNGYYAFRMLGDGAKQVIGVDPGPLYNLQFQVFKQYMGQAPIYTLPLTGEEIAGCDAQFDTVFSMGVLYHRREPLGHLSELFKMLIPGGELLLETLIIETGEQEVLVPRERYAKMRNVWFIPRLDHLSKSLQQCGFKNIRVVDVTSTTIQEQRRTDWMRFESLEDFLDPRDNSKTIEGYPAPTRAIIVAEK